ncbi:MAG: hypothetical protein A2039_10170 [Candidatus Melainabacteria bacterium GWA2_34_9]|nr:MAG: hypothetical protein A2039_10170 [Candidatus Melainabacteria bacterium GWA2_34_9]
MDYLNLPIDKAQQYAKIIEDTEEIIQNFREVSELMVERLEKTENSMFTLGKKVIHDRGEFLNNSINLGNDQVNFI